MKHQDENEKPDITTRGGEEKVSTPALKDVTMARRMFGRAALLIPPAVVASLTVSKPVAAQTCGPFACQPECNPCFCGPGDPKICGPCPNN